MLNVVRWVMATLAALLAIGPPLAFYRYQYVHAKRFHEVTPGRYYRSGQMTAAGFRDIVGRYKIKLFINLQHEEPDPWLADHWLGRGKIRESELCRELGVKYVLLTPDVMPADVDPSAILPSVDEFLKLLDDESNYPVLVHCKAGLHRTGRLTAIYRMEFLGWTQGEAMRELRANGYGYAIASESDQMIVQFIENYVPRKDRARQLSVAPPPHDAPLGASNDGGIPEGGMP